MANNPYVNKIIYNSGTLIDLTSDTITSNSLKLGETAVDASGATITGTLTVPTATIIVTAPTGSTVVLTKPDSTTETGTEISGTWTFSNLTAFGTYSVTATLGSKSKTVSVLVDTIADYNVAISYSRLPVGFEEANYISTTSGATPYIQTVIRPTSSTVLKAKFEQITYGEWEMNISAVRSGYNNKCWEAIFNSTNNTKNTRIDYGNAEWTVSQNPLSLNTEYTFEYGAGTYKLNGQTYTKSISFTTTGYDMPLFAFRNGNSWNITSISNLHVKEIAWYNDADLIAQFIPCYCTTSVTAYKGSTAVTASSGTVGMYDLIGNKFYISSNSYVFTYG